MKKSTTIGTISFMVILVAVVGIYAFFSERTRNTSADSEMTAVTLALSRNLQNDYPPTVKEVVKYFTEIQKCLYKGEWTEEEFEQLSMKARELVDPELQEKNEPDSYVVRLKQDVDGFQAKNWQMSTISVASSNNVDYFEADGYSFARILCKYTVRQDGKPVMSETVYLLRRDENRRWRIYGWDRAENVNLQDL